MNIEIKPYEGHYYVSEDLFHAVLQRMVSLTKDQRTALRSHDREKIADCQRRENGLLQFASSYEQTRTAAMSLFQEGGAKQ